MGKHEKKVLHSWQVERRKYQNAAAQRRRRARLRDEERVSLVAEYHDHLRADVLHHPQATANGTPNVFYQIIATMSNVFVSDAERTNFAIIVASENFSLRDIIKYGLISLGYAMTPQLYCHAERLPFYGWIQSVLSAFDRNLNLEEIVLAGVRTLSSLNGPGIWFGQLSSPASRERAWSTGSPLMAGTIHSPLSMGFFTACLANCRQLGLDPHSIMKDDAISPFSRVSEGVVGGKSGRRSSESSGTAELEWPIQLHGLAHDMRPIPEQFTIPHHPYLDIIPWPSFRARAIVASSADPPLIDEADLCLDLLNDGLYCWGMHGASLYGRGEGTPWDSRSWEAKPWFLKKWSHLTSGADVQRSSAWWRSNY